MALYNQASFKNSRVSTRKATTFADVKQVTVPTGANFLVSAANPNRTYITLRNENGTTGNDIRYDYFDNPSILTEGFLLRAGEAVDLEATQDIYARGVASSVICSIDEGQG